MINIANIPFEDFERYKLKNKAVRYEEDCNDFDLREAIRDDLLLKQRSQCAYCERKITKEKSSIEHISPRDKAHKLECEYSNIVLSCKSEYSCNRYKGNKKWEDKYIHPVLSDPTEYFYFSSNGQILSNNKNAKDTIEYLNLNSNQLIRLRKNLVESLIAMKNVENLSQYFNEFENLIKEFI